MDKQEISTWAIGIIILVSIYFITLQIQPVENPACADALDKNKCYLSQAVGKNNPGPCRYIGNKSIAYECYLKTLEKCENNSEMECRIQTGALTASHEICQKFSRKYQEDKCYQEIAQELGNKSICEKIYDNWEKNQCYYNLGECQEINNSRLRKQCQN